MHHPFRHYRPALRLLTTSNTQRLLFTGMAALLASLASPVALADEVRLAPSATLTCLTLPPGVPEQPTYPAELLERKEGGTLHVELTFTAPDKKPGFKLTGDKSFEGFDRLSELVQAHTDQYRLPCMSATGASVTMRQDYVFDPLGPGVVMASAPVDAADAARRKQVACRTHISGANAKPDYPATSATREEEGKVWVRMRFTAPDRPPTVKIVAATPHGTLRNAATNFSEGYRLPCLQNGPIEVDQIYSFGVEGSSRMLLRDMPLKTFLGAAKSYPKPAYFDLNSMACPFELRISYKQPWGKNHVAELDQSNPARAPLLNWLGGIVLSLTDKQGLAVMGDQFNVEIPCGTIDL